MANLFLERYLNGEHAEVWADLVDLGTAVRSQGYYKDAIEVAVETMKRARHNVESIIVKLEKLGYEFSKEEASGVFSPPTPKAALALDRFEGDIGGPLPISLRQWYEHVGVVNLMGHHEALNPSDGRIFSDPLVIDPFTESPGGDFDGDFSKQGTGMIELELAPSADLKAHQFQDCGDPECYSMKVPDLAVDGLLLWELHCTTFVNYLRLVFQWGGFPGWHAENEAPQQELDFLKRGLLPI